MTIAAIVWHKPCAAGVRVELTADIDPGRTWENEDAVADIPGCRVQLNPKISWPWPVLCATLLHEYGHLAGYRDPTNTTDPTHSSNPNSVMSAGGVFTENRYWLDGRWHTEWVTDRRCADNGRPFLRRAAAAQT